MVTVRLQFEQLLFAEITTLNGENTEEDLNMAITKETTKNKIKRVESLITETLEAEDDIAKLEPNGAWIYSDGSVEEFLFERYETIADAVKAAVNMINAKIICNGNLVTYDTLSDEEAYYIDDEAGKVKLVRLCA